MSYPKAGVVLGTLGKGGQLSLLAEIKTYIFNLCSRLITRDTYRSNVLRQAMQTCDRFSALYLDDPYGPESGYP